jgi:hypothetical protein
LYNQFPKEVRQTEETPASSDPNDVWVMMSKKSLDEYIQRVRMKFDSFVITPDFGDLGSSDPIIIYGFSNEQQQIIINEIKRKFGDLLKNKVVDMISARNIVLSKSTNFILQMSNNFSAPSNLLSVGALNTAKLIVLQLKGSYPEHSDIFDYTFLRIDKFSNSIGNM